MAIRTYHRHPDLRPNGASAWVVTRTASDRPKLKRRGWIKERVDTMPTSIYRALKAKSEGTYEVMLFIGKNGFNANARPIEPALNAPVTRSRP